MFMTEVCAFYVGTEFWLHDNSGNFSVHNNFSRDFLHCLKYLLKRKFPNPGWRFLVTSFQWGCLANEEHWLLHLVALRQTSVGASRLLCRGRPCCQGIMHWTSGFALSSSAVGIMPWPQGLPLYMEPAHWVGICIAIIQSQLQHMFVKFFN